MKAEVPAPAEEQKKTAPTSRTATGSRSTEVSFFAYLREAASGAAVLLQEAPVAVATEAACVLQDVPVVRLVCKTFLLLELVETAKRNKGDLVTLLDLCDVVITSLEERTPGTFGPDRRRVHEAAGTRGKGGGGRKAVQRRIRETARFGSQDLQRHRCCEEGRPGVLNSKWSRPF